MSFNDSEHLNIEGGTWESSPFSVTFALCNKKTMENRKIIVNIRNVVTRLPELRFEEPLNWIIEEGQQWAVIGPNAPGKTLIADDKHCKLALNEGEVSFG